MTSESSSAVLDLNNVDTEDTEPPSSTEDTKDIVPLIMEHGFDIAVKVDAPIKQLSTLETFVTYRVRCVCARWPTPPYVRRRYNHFKLLHKRLAQSHPLVAPPPLPPLHSARQQLDRYSPSFVAIRTLALHAFLDRVAKHPILTYSDDFRMFLTTPDEEFDKVFRSENSALNLWGLSAAFYGSGETKPANGARVKDPEFTAASDYLQSLQQKLTALCALTTKMQKGTAALSNEMMGMKRACDLWSCQERPSVSRASGACASGANAAHRATLIAARAPPVHRAILPMLAAYAGAHVEKINNRDAIHATYVSGADTTNDVHNRLEQASEALRSELADWLPKTHMDIKNLLLDLATRQVNLQTQILMGWEHALKLSTDATVDEMFKTVSKSAVQNLSPSKCRSPNETERDYDDFEDVSNDSDSRDAFVSDDGNAEIDTPKLSLDDEFEVTNRVENVEEDAADSRTTAPIVSSVDGDDIGNKCRADIVEDNAVSRLEMSANVADFKTNEYQGYTNTKEFDNELYGDERCKANLLSETGVDVDAAANCRVTSEVSSVNDGARSDTVVLDNILVPNSDKSSEVTQDEATKINSTEFLNEILDDKTESSRRGNVLNDKFKDPLSEFSDIDLS